MKEAKLDGLIVDQRFFLLFAQVRDRNSVTIVAGQSSV
jgi:hypothetical protein